MEKDIELSRGSVYGKKLSEQFFIIGFTCWTIYQFFFLTTVVPSPAATFKIFRLLGVAMMILSIFAKLNVKLRPFQTILLAVCILFLALDNYLFSSHALPVEYTIILFAAIDVNFNRVLKFYIPIRFALLVGTIVLALLRLIPNMITSDSRHRYYLGFYWTSYASFMFLFLILICMHYYQARIKWWTAGVILLVNQALFMYTDTKFPYLITVAVVLVWLSMKYFAWFRKALVFISPWVSAVLFAGLTLLNITLSYTQGAESVLNKLFSGRFVLGHTALSHFGGGLIGKNLGATTRAENPLQAYFTIDSGLLKIFVQLGLVAFVIYMVAYWVVQYRLLGSLSKYPGSLYSLVAIWIIICTGFTDPWMMYIDFNVFLLMIPNAVVLPQSGFDKMSVVYDG